LGVLIYRLLFIHSFIRSLCDTCVSLLSLRQFGLPVVFSFLFLRMWELPVTDRGAGDYGRFRAAGFYSVVCLRAFLSILATSPPADPTPGASPLLFPTSHDHDHDLSSFHYEKRLWLARPIPSAAPPFGLSRPQMCQPAHPQESQHMFHPSLILMLYVDGLEERASEGKGGVQRCRHRMT
jgi:hypothetical protein